MADLIEQLINEASIGLNEVAIGERWYAIGTSDRVIVSTDYGKTWDEIDAGYWDDFVSFSEVENG